VELGLGQPDMTNIFIAQLDWQVFSDKTPACVPGLCIHVTLKGRRHVNQHACAFLPCVVDLRRTVNCYVERSWLTDGTSGNNIGTIRGGAVGDRAGEAWQLISNIARKRGDSGGWGVRRRQRSRSGGRRVKQRVIGCK
jgi:hypothetical protein